VKTKSIIMTKRLKITYWVFTGLFSALMMMASIPDILRVPEAVAIFKHLGYPSYLLPFIGVAKLLGVVAILVPGFLGIKEWAYAGLCFDLTGALYSGLAVGDPVSSIIPALTGLVLLTGSYIFYHKKLMKNENRK
jgi:DoxX-like family